MNDLSTALGRVKNALASNLGADGVLVLAKGDVAELLALIETRAPLDYGSLDAVQRLAVCRGDVLPASAAPSEPDRIKGMVETIGGQYAVMIDPENGHSIDRTTNTVELIAQATMSATWDCCHVAVKATIADGCTFPAQVD